jgi:hypothetical protein
LRTFCLGKLNTSVGQSCYNDFAATYSDLTAYGALQTEVRTALGSILPSSTFGNAAFLRARAKAWLYNVDRSALTIADTNKIFEELDLVSANSGAAYGTQSDVDTAVAAFLLRLTNTTPLGRATVAEKAAGVLIARKVWAELLYLKQYTVTGYNNMILKQTAYLASTNAAVYELFTETYFTFIASLTPSATRAADLKKYYVYITVMGLLGEAAGRKVVNDIIAYETTDAPTYTALEDAFIAAKGTVAPGTATGNAEFLLA